MKYKFTWLLFITIYFISIKNYGQKEASLFFFNKGAAVNFQSPQPSISNLGPLFAPYTGIASICNSKGELVFYTNGTTIYDSKHEAVPNGSGLTWTVARTNLLIIPVGVQEKKYFLVTADNFNLTYDTGTPNTGNICCYKNDTTLCYSLINVETDKKVILNQKNIPLLKPAFNLVAATKHKNGIDTWLVTMEYNTNKFYAFLFNECGVSAPIISQLNVKIVTPNAIFLGFSPNGSKLVATLAGNYLMDFDNETGILSNPTDITSYVSSGVLAFSPNSKYLYCHYDKSGENFVQFDIESQTIQSFKINSSNVSDSGLGSSMSLAVDGKLYFNGGGWRNILCAYENPNEPLSKSNLKYNLGLINDPSNIFPIFPNFVSNYFDPNYTSQQLEIGKPSIELLPRYCEGDSVKLKLYKAKAVNEYFWDFGDGNTAYNIKEPSHSYKQSGDYIIRLIVRYNCSFDTIYTQVKIDGKREPELIDTIFGCQKTTLNVGDNYISYLWEQGDTSPQKEIFTEGDYQVKLTNACGIYENKYHFLMPRTITTNLITPNKDGKNDNLYFEDYSIPVNLEIFNRWGSKVFESKDYKNNWPIDELEDGLYFYKINYSGCSPVKSWLQVLK